MTRRRVITDEMADALKHLTEIREPNFWDRRAAVEVLYDLIAVEVLEDVATDFIDWDALDRPEELIPEVQAQHDTANYIGQVALEYRRGDVR